MCPVKFFHLFFWICLSEKNKYYLHIFSNTFPSQHSSTWWSFPSGYVRNLQIWKSTPGWLRVCAKDPQTAFALNARFLHFLIACSLMEEDILSISWSLGPTGSRAVGGRLEQMSRSAGRSPSIASLMVGHDGHLKGELLLWRHYLPKAMHTRFFCQCDNLALMQKKELSQGF